jgi:hypothetical protein
VISRQAPVPGWATTQTATDAGLRPSGGTAMRWKLARFAAIAALLSTEDIDSLNHSRGVRLPVAARSLC